MRILVVGAGAVGGYFGTRLVEAGRDVTFLVREGRAAQIREKGLEILSPLGDAHVAPTLVTASEITSPYDLVLLSVKAYAIEKTMADLAPAIGENTLLLPLLNGMRHMDLLTSRFGSAKLLGGVCLVMTQLDEAGRIVQLSTMQQVIYGERDGRVTPAIQAVDAALSNAGFEATLSTNIMQAMWQKWVQLASLGGVTCLMRSPIGPIAAHAEGLEFAKRFLDECAAIATRCGYPPSSEFYAKQTAALTDPESSLASSMYRDLMQGRPVEVEAILGDLLTRGRQHGLVCPLLEAAVVHLTVYQSQQKPQA